MAMCQAQLINISEHRNVFIKYYEILSLKH